MSSTVKASVVPRGRAEWMRPVDEAILEHLRSEGNLTPDALEKLDVAVANYASNRLTKLRKYGLVERAVPGVRGLYRITDAGEAFLDEELDAAELEPTDA